MSIRALVEKSRSCRGYNPDRAVTKEELLELVDCARLCPSSGNIQPLKYFLSWKPEEVKSIHPLTKWARALPQLQLPHPGMEPTAYIIICLDTEIDKSMAVFQKDVGIVAQTMMLAASEKGLACCMIGSFQAGALSEALQLPETILPMLVLAIGEPAEEVRLTEMQAGESTAYYRDEADVHYVPKRSLEALVLSSED